MNISGLNERVANESSSFVRGQVDVSQELIKASSISVPFNMQITGVRYNVKIRRLKMLQH